MANENVNIEVLMNDVLQKKNQVDALTNQVIKSDANFRIEISTKLARLRETIRQLLNSDQFRELLDARAQIQQVNNELQRARNDLAQTQTNLVNSNNALQEVRAELEKCDQLRNEADNNIERIQREREEQINTLTAQHQRETQAAANASEAEKQNLREQHEAAMAELRANLDNQLQQASDARNQAETQLRNAQNQLQQSAQQQQKNTDQLVLINQFLNEQLQKLGPLADNNRMHDIQGLLQALQQELDDVVNRINAAPGENQFRFQAHGQPRWQQQQPMEVEPNQPRRPVLRGKLAEQLPSDEQSRKRSRPNEQPAVPPAEQPAAHPLTPGQLTSLRNEAIDTVKRQYQGQGEPTWTDDQWAEVFQNIASQNPNFRGNLGPTKRMALITMAISKIWNDYVDGRPPGSSSTTAFGGRRTRRRGPPRRYPLKYRPHSSYPHRRRVTRRQYRGRRPRRATCRHCPHHRRRPSARPRSRRFRGGYTYKKNTDLDKRSSEVNEKDKLSPLGRDSMMSSAR